MIGMMIFTKGNNFRNNFRLYFDFSREFWNFSVFREFFEILPAGGGHDEV